MYLFWISFKNVQGSYKLILKVNLQLSMLAKLLVDKIKWVILKFINKLNFLFKDKLKTLNQTALGNTLSLASFKPNKIRTIPYVDLSNYQNLFLNFKVVKQITPNSDQKKQKRVVRIWAKLKVNLCLILSNLFFQGTTMFFVAWKLMTTSSRDCYVVLKS